MARKMVCEWGMSEKLGPLTFGKREEHIFLGREFARHQDYSEETAVLIDAEVKQIVLDSAARARSILEEQIARLHRLGQGAAGARVARRRGDRACPRRRAARRSRRRPGVASGRPRGPARGGPRRPGGAADSGREAPLARGRVRVGRERPRTLIMGIVNVTPDSFADGGRYLEPAAAVTRRERSSPRAPTSSTSVRSRRAPGRRRCRPTRSGRACCRCSSGSSTTLHARSRWTRRSPRSPRPRSRSARTW